MRYTFYSIQIFFKSSCQFMIQWVGIMIIKKLVANKKKIDYPLSVYTSYIDQMKEKLFPIKLKFGLEVCYEPE